MRLSKDRFSVPFCILNDDLPPITVMVLLFLLKESDCPGCASVSYEDIKRGAGITSRSTVSRSLKLLNRHGWFHWVRKGGGKRAVYFLRLPPRFTETDDSKHDHLKVRILPRQ